MNYLALIMPEHEPYSEMEKQLARFGFRRCLASEDRRLAIQLPYPAFAGMRDGDSAEEIRDSLMKELKNHDICDFVLVAENFTCGRI